MSMRTSFSAHPIGAPKTIKVWDLFVRVFHWSLVTAILSQLITAEDFPPAHVRIGYFIIALAVVHICGVFVSSYVHKENLVLAMVTGRKKNG